MTRDLAVERLYFLGDYKNIKFSNVLKDVPDEIAQNDKAVELLYTQQFITVEIAYRKYYELIGKISKQKSEEVQEFLEAQRVQTMKELKEEIDAIYMASVKQPELITEETPTE